jgi:hypothetical protein
MISMERKRVKCYLDFDGALNSLGSFYSSTFIPAWDDNEIITEGGYELNVSRSQASRLVAMSMEIHWCTTWCQTPEDLQRVAAHLNIPCDNILDLSEHWKTEAVILDQKIEPSPFVWIDDDAISTYTERNFELLHDEGLMSPHLLVRPDPSYGLTSDDLDVIEAFITEE